MSSRRRTLLKSVACFILLGAGMTVAMAWACAYWVDLRNEKTQIVGQFPDPSLPSDVDGWNVRTLSAFGTKKVFLLARDIPENPGPLQSLPYWSTICDDGLSHSAESKNAGRFTSRMLMEDGRGWPLIALGYRWHIFGDPDPYTYAIRLPSWEEPEGSMSNLQSERALPLRVYWIGFLVDTLFWGVALRIVVLGWRDIRDLRRWRRRKQGRCAYCNYTLVGDLGSLCPECGRPKT